MTALDEDIAAAWATGLSGVGDEALAALTQRTKRRCLAPRQVLYEQGDTSPKPALYVVVSGLLAVEQRSVTGGRRLLAVLASGDLAGEVGVLDPKPRSARMEAVLATAVGEARRADLLTWLTEFPSASGTLVRAVSHRVQHAEDSLVDQAALGTTERVTRLLLELARRWGSPDPDGSVVVAPLTQEQLARLVGCSREVMNRTLKHLASLGLLTVARRHVVLLDLPRLQAPAPECKASSRSK